MRLSTSLPVVFSFFTLPLSAQFIAAGQHVPGQYYIDIQPDTTLIAPFALPIMNAHYPLDMNGDGVVDFELHVYNNNGLGIKVTHCYIEPMNDNEIAVAYTDSCFSTGCGYVGLSWEYGMVRAYEYGEAIDASAHWADSLVYLSYDRFVGGCIDCNDRSFADTAANYIGVRYFAAADTAYGWIKVSNVSNIACTIESIGSESATTAIAETSVGTLSVRVSPNPASGLPGFDFGKGLPDNAVLNIWDNTGRPVLRQELEAGARGHRPDGTSLPGGVYYFSIHGAGEATSGKFVVQE